MKLLCPNSCKKKCYLKFTGEEQKTFFESYWKMGDSKKQKQFDANNITVCDKEREREMWKGFPEQKSTVNNDVTSGRCCSVQNNVFTNVMCG